MKEKIMTYQESYEYSWVKSRSRTWAGGEAVNTFKDLLPAEFYKKNTLIYVLDEKQLYRAKHKRILNYIGMIEQEAK